MSLSSQKLYGSVLLSPHAKEYGFEFSSPTCYNEKSLKFPPSQFWVKRADWWLQQLITKLWFIVLTAEVHEYKLTKNLRSMDEMAHTME